MKQNVFKNKYLKIFILIIMIFLVFSFNANYIFAEINEGYATETISQSFLDELGILSSLVQPIGLFLLWIGGFIEWVLSSVSLIITGQDTAIMPWADAIIFNAVPALDINFISPNSNAMISNFTGLISKLYYTVLLLSITFTGLGIMLNAVKLAVSAIAQDKAKYKQMIYNSFMCLLLLFTIHYLISFVFFLNESLVKMAGSIVTTNIAGAKIFTTEEINDGYNVLVGDVEKFITDAGEKEKILSRIKGNSDFYKKLITESPDDLKGDVFRYEADIIGIDIGVNKTDAIRRMYDFYDLVTKISDEEIKELNETENDVKTAIYIAKISKKYIDQDRILAKEILMSESYHVNPGSSWESGSGNSSASLSSYKNLNLRLKVLIVNYNNDLSDSSNLSYPIANLATYLRTNSMQSKDGSFVRDNVSLPFCIMYLMFVIQSLLFFWSYAKRLFFVMIFAVMAPAIIVWDYINKA